MLSSWGSAPVLPFELAGPATALSAAACASTLPSGVPDPVLPCGLAGPLKALPAAACASCNLPPPVRAANDSVSHEPFPPSRAVVFPSNFSCPSGCKTEDGASVLSSVPLAPARAVAECNVSSGDCFACGPVPF